MPTAHASTLPVPGSLFRFTVRTADEAAQAIRDRLGENARVVSVQQVRHGPFGGLFSSPRLEVIAQHGATDQPESDDEADGETDDAHVGFAVTSDEPARPEPAAAPQSPPTPTPALVVSATARPSAPTVSRLPDLLRRSGISEQMLARLKSVDHETQTIGRPLHQSLAAVGQELRRRHEAVPARPLPARAAFLGSPGVGRTTALCKWLAGEVYRRARHGLVMRAEFDRPNPAGHLAVFCEALGVPLIHGPGPLPTAVDGGGFLYVDLPGLSIRHPAKNRAIGRYLDAEKIDGRILVLNAAYDHATLRQADVAGRDLGATHVVFTHLDELDHWGKLWDHVIDGGLTPLFLSTGPSLTGECEEEVCPAILRKTLPGA
jgi:flagellar biosynthesis protein FlhF